VRRLYLADNLPQLGAFRVSTVRRNLIERPAFEVPDGELPARRTFDAGAGEGEGGAAAGAPKDLESHMRDFSWLAAA